ncbi:MAG TPA: PQQ-binding-like beta-propeller repeat protein [Candidatus Binatia bacterium]
MRREAGWLATVLLCGVWVGCSSSGPATCSFNDPPSFPAVSGPTPHPWQKFRYDHQNTGAVLNPNVVNNPMCRWVFPPSGKSPCPSGTPGPAKGRFAASPVLNSTEARIYIGSTDGTLYALNTSDGTQNTNFNFSTLGTEPITSTALLATRDNGDAVYLGGGDGLLYGLTATGSALADYWPASIGNLISASPTVGNDGTVYVASLAGLLAGVCPNGVERFVLSYAGIQSSPAQGADATLYFGADDSQLHAVQPDGPVKWTFSAAGPILAAPVFDADTNSIYVADNYGYVFKIGTDGKPDPTFAFPPSACAGNVKACPPSSPALAGDHLYLGSSNHNLYAIDKVTGAIVWTVETGDAIESSPAVAINGDQRIVVVGSNDGNVYFVEDKVDSNGNFIGNVGTFPIGPAVGSSPATAVRSSPAIGSDGTVYVGADDGRVYAIAPQ